jgi:hypothetical protein
MAMASNESGRDGQRDRSYALRIGVTGARKLPSARLCQIQKDLQQLFEIARNSLDGRGDIELFPIAGRPIDRTTLISALARGADRVAARQALALGCWLSVAMPFAGADYLLDFKGSEDPAEALQSPAEDRAEFEYLLGQAGDRWLALDGSRAQDPDRAYEAVGRFVARHSDILIAVWDGQAAQGRGGTADIIRYATNLGVPVWWIHATEDRTPAWIADHHDIHATHAPGAAEERLRVYIQALITEPAPARPHRHHWIGRLARIGQSHAPQPLHEFLAEPVPTPNPIWRIYSAFMRLASGRANRIAPVARPHRPDAQYWFDRYAAADTRATAYAARYRSSYVWILLFGTAAVICGALPPVLRLFGPEIIAIRTAAIGELLALFLIVVVVGATIRNGWHERFIEYRLLAELCRAQQALTYVGWTVANGRVRRIASEQRLSWVAWLFAAYQRAAPLPQGEIAAAMHDEAQSAMGELITQQLEYYENRAAIADAAQRRFSLLGTICFAGLLICVALKFAETWQHWPDPLTVTIGLLATLLPGFSAAFAAIGAYAELQILSDQSHHMVAELNLAKARLERLRHLGGTRPLLSQELGNEAAAISTFMLQELDGWAALFRAKVIETG